MWFVAIMRAEKYEKQCVAECAGGMPVALHKHAWRVACLWLCTSMYGCHACGFAQACMEGGTP